MSKRARACCALLIKSCCRFFQPVNNNRLALYARLQLSKNDAGALFCAVLLPSGAELKLKIFFREWRIFCPPGRLTRENDNSCMLYGMEYFCCRNIPCADCIIYSSIGPSVPMTIVTNPSIKLIPTSLRIVAIAAPPAFHSCAATARNRRR
jgi:hypothetical protein